MPAEKPASNSSQRDKDMVPVLLEQYSTESEEDGRRERKVERGEYGEGKRDMGI